MYLWSARVTVNFATTLEREQSQAKDGCEEQTELVTGEEDVSAYLCMYVNGGVCAQFAELNSPTLDGTILFNFSSSHYLIIWTFIEMLRCVEGNKTSKYLHRLKNEAS